MSKIIFDMDKLHRDSMDGNSMGITMINDKFPQPSMENNKLLGVPPPNLKRFKKDTSNMEINEGIKYLEKIIEKIETECYVDDFLKEFR